MRGKIILAALMLPVAHAYSLNDFQSLNSNDISKKCQEAYKSQIPYCSIKDFTESCSAHCVTGLYSIAEKVSSACEDISAGSSTLLGMVLSGGMANSLCPLPKLKTTIFSSMTSSPEDSKGDTGITNIGTPRQQPTTLSLTIISTPSVSTPSVSTPLISIPSLPTPSAFTPSPLFGPKLSTSLSTSSFYPAPSTSEFSEKTSLIPSSTATITSSTLSSQSIPSPTMSSRLLPSSSSSSFSIYSSSSSSSLRTTTKTKPTPSSSPGQVDGEPFTGGTGGGSPFDTKSGASNTDKSSLCAMVIALVWACILQR